MKRILVVAFCLLWLFPEETAAGEKALEKRMCRHVETLASDHFEGRGAQTRGDTLAVTYLLGELRAQRGISLLGNDGLQRFSAEGQEGEQVASFNIVGWIEGNDPRLKDEVVVIGAHYDHVGYEEELDEDGNILARKTFYGADDNASGVAFVLELARELGKHRKQLKRSVMIVFFGAEEEGLLGSEYLCRHPVWPPEKRLVYMVNADMVGRLTPGRGLTLWGVGSAFESEAFIRSVPFPLADEVKMNYVVGDDGGSDHRSFYDIARIPVLCFTTGIHADYHQPGDTAQKINFYGMSILYDYARRIIRGVTETGRPMTYDPAANFKNVE